VSWHPFGRPVVPGVDDRGDVSAADLGTPGLHSLIRDLAPGGPELVEPAGLDLPQMTQVGQIGLCLGQDRGVCWRLQNHGSTPRVLDDPADLKGGRSLIDRDRNRAGRPDGKVRHGPLVAGPAHDRDALPEADSGRHQSFGDRLDVSEELRVRDLDPGTRRRLAEGNGERIVAVVADREIREVAADLSGDEGANRDLLHEGSLDCRLVFARVP